MAAIGMVQNKGREVSSKFLNIDGNVVCWRDTTIQISNIAQGRK